MVYINEKSFIVNFPRTSKTIVNKLIITNQTTKQQVELSIEDNYKVDISSVLDWFNVCQYDYQFMYNDKVISSGILQYGDYAHTTETYNNKYNIIQYTP